MLCAKQKSTGETVSAYLASKTNAPFFCPVCGDEVILKIGATKVNYFAHKNPLICRYDANESAEHRQCKFEIYEALLRQANVEKAANYHLFQRCAESFCWKVCYQLVFQLRI